VPRHRRHRVWGVVVVVDFLVSLDVDFVDLVNGVVTVVYVYVIVRCRWCEATHGVNDHVCDHDLWETAERKAMHTGAP
jgi:hypothetical protein